MMDIELESAHEFRQRHIVRPFKELLKAFAAR